MTLTRIRCCAICLMVSKTSDGSHDVRLPTTKRTSRVEWEGVALRDNKSERWV